MSALKKKKQLFERVKPAREGTANIAPLDARVLTRYRYLHDRCLYVVAFRLAHLPRITHVSGRLRVSMVSIRLPDFVLLIFRRTSLRLIGVVCY